MPESPVVTAPPPDDQLNLGLRTSALVAMIVLVALLTFVPVASNDVWLQAKLGELIVENRAIPHTVLFPFTWVRDNPFNAHEWLPSIAFHLLDRAVSHEGLLFVQGALGLALFGLCTSLAVRLSKSMGAGLLLAALAMVVANFRFHLRPELFALLLMVALLHLLYRYRSSGNRRALLWSLPIAVLWANTHGSFLLGPGIAAIFAVGEGLDALRRRSAAAWPARWRAAWAVAAPYAAVSVGMGLASLANPLGIGLLHFALTLSASEVTKTFIAEWVPTLSKSFTGRLPFAIFVAALAVTLGVVASLRRRLGVTDALLLLAFGLLAFQRSRFVALYGFIAMAVCARLIGAGPHRPGWERPLLAGAAGVGAIGVALALQFGNVWGAFPYAVPSNNFTEPMIARLARPEMRGNVFNSYELGAELIYRAYPRLRPSMDSRIDSYGDTYFLVQEQLLVDEAMLKEFIADFDVRYMLLLRRDFVRIRDMPSMKQGWYTDFADQKMLLLARRPEAASAPVVPAGPDG